ncbi:MAG: hypothetical protein IMF06_06490 [Proteobacteria bacterium]|nr:hypothetical protein [Pseudomonadota bacterium]
MAKAYTIESKLPTVQYYCSNDNDDPTAFLTAINQGLSRLSTSFGSTLDPTTSYSLSPFEAISEHLQSSWILYLEDYHQLTPDGELNMLLASLAQNADQLGLQLLVTSRASPPAHWSGAVLKHRVEIFSDLNFNMEELSEIVAEYPVFAEHDAQWLQDLLDYTDGWPAGVILLLERLRLELDEGLSLSETGTQATSDYFMNAIFRHFPEEVQTLLLKSSVLPFLPADDAEDILQIPSAGKLFSTLCNQRTFTFRQTRCPNSGTESKNSYPAFQHQNLFHDFLRQQAEVYLTREDRLAVAQRGAARLEAHGDFSAATAIYVEHEKWEEITALILNNALQLIDSGQIAQLDEAFSRLPDKLIDANPDLLFWCGVCETSLGLASAREHLSKAYGLYCEQGNTVGMAISWRAVVDAIWLSWDGLDQLGDWIKEYDLHADTDYASLPDSFQTSLMMSRFGILSFWSPEHPELPQLEQQLASHVHTPMPTQERALLFVKILYHFTYGTGNQSQTDFYLNVMRTMVQQSPGSPLDQILLSNFEAAYQYCFVGSPKKCYEYVDEALTIGNESGVLVWQSVSLTHGLYMALGQGDIRRTKKYLKQFKQVIGLNNSMHVAFDELFSGWLAMLEGRHSSALRHVDAGLIFLEHNPIPMIRNLFLGGKAALLIQREEWHEAWVVLREVRSFAKAARSNTLEIMARFLQASWCLKRNRLWAARAFLQRARDIGVTQNIFVCPWLAPAQLPGLIAFAIESDIDSGYFSRWVSLYSLKVPSGFAARVRWPWRIKIRTLGALEIRLDGRMLESQGRAHKRLLEILGALITAGPRGISQGELMNEMWPDKSEEKGRSNLNTNLARLRTFIGDPNAVISSEGRVFISRDICWVDSWEFLAESEVGSHIDIDQLVQAEHAYQGEYCVPETGNGAETILRSALANRYLKVARSLARAFEKDPDYTQAIDIYRNILSKLGAEENIYRDLMCCYAKMNRLEGVSVIYGECKQVMLEKYGGGPSKETTNLYQRLISQAD